MKKVMLVVEKVERLILFFAQGAIFIMMFLITADAISRYLFQQSIIGVYEFTERYLMIAAVFLSMSYVMKIDGHIRLNLLIDRLPVKVSRVFNLIFLLLGAAFVFSIGYQGMIMTYEAWANNIAGTGLIPWPVWLSYIWVPIGAYLFTLRLLLQFIGIVFRDKTCEKRSGQEGIL